LQFWQQFEFFTFKSQQFESICVKSLKQQVTEAKLKQK